jgi:non-specific serine/threonine protein kinase
MGVVMVGSFGSVSPERGRPSSVRLARLRPHARDGRPHNLSQPLTSFIGRKREIAEARRLFEATRLLTLTGAGGVGKTRLGHEIAAGLLDDPEHGVWLVELAALADPLLVPQAVAASLGVREEPERSLAATLVDALRPRQLLLVLDACEHLIEACAALADALLRACPGLRILATSRQPLGIAGETTLRVPSLSLAPSLDGPPLPSAGTGEAGAGVGGLPTAPERGQFSAEPEAIRLFVERARAAVPAFTLTDRNLAAVVQICRRLDGIPLALELAAARATVLSPEQIAVRLGDRFRLLTGGSRTALPRHRTLRASIDWSHDLLGEAERTLLRRLTVFAGGWTLEAAEAVCAGDGLASEEVLDLLSELTAKSLVQTQEHTEEVRYRFLESIREYAAEKLRDAGEEPLLRGRHRDWFLSLAERAEPQLRGPHSVSWLDRLERERDNLRAALGWCVERAEAEPGLRLAGALARFWLVRGPYREVRGTLTELLTVPSALERSGPALAARAKALDAAGRLAMRQDDRAAADAYFQEGLEIDCQLGDRRGLAVALFQIGHVARVRGEYPVARSRFDEARRIFEALGDSYWLAQTHQDLGVAAFFQGHLATAREEYETSLALYKQLGDELGIVSALNDLGEVALLDGELESARSFLSSSLAMARRLDDKERIAMALAGLAGLAAAQGRATRALHLEAAALALNDATGQRNSPAWYAMVERWLEPARRALGADAAAAAQAAGQAIPLDEAIECALAADDPVGDEAARHVASQAPRAASVLSRRELDVTALVARGMTNRQIADELVIAEGTAANHIKHILNKLALDSRVQIAAWAVEQGLHRRPSP